MSSLLRFGVSMDAELLSAFDHFIESRGYDNRSEALRDLVRDAIVATRKTDAEQVVVANLWLVHDLRSEVVGKLAQVRRERAGLVLGAMSIPLGIGRHAELIMLKGEAGVLQGVADELIPLRGVSQGSLEVMSAE